MAAVSATTSLFSYKLLPWGDLIYGSKAELQELGLGVGRAFPGEPGGPRRKLNIIDPRGFPCHIGDASYHGAGQFVAGIAVPGRERHAETLECYLPGISIERRTYADCYRGTAAALIAAGLAQAEQFPGAPSRAKTATQFMADGTYATNCTDLDAGGIRIERATARLFRILVYVGSDEARARKEAWSAAQQAYEERMARTPRPRPLAAQAREAQAQARRAQLRLAWSRPAPTFSFAENGLL